MQRFYDLGTKNRIEIAILIVLPFIILFTLFLVFPSLVDVWNLRINDQMVRLRLGVRGPQPVDVRVVHIDFNDSSMWELQRNKYDRSLYGEIINVLNAAGVKAIVFDIFFSDYIGALNKEALRDAINRTDTVYLPIVPLIEGDWSGSSLIRSDNMNNYIIKNLWYPLSIPESQGVTAINFLPIDESLILDTIKSGHIFCEPDIDGVYRRIPLIVGYNDGYIPTIGLRAAADFLGVSDGDIQVRFGKSITLKSAVLPSGIVKDIVIPIDRQGMQIINYAGYWTDSFCHYSFKSILMARDAGGLEQLREQLEGSIAIVSDTTTAGKDHGTTPLEKVYPISGIHANIINSILTDNFMHFRSFVLEICLYIFFMFGMWYAAVYFRPSRFVMVSILLYVCVMLFLVVNFVCFSRKVDLITPSVAFIFCFGSVVLYRSFAVLKKNMDHIICLNDASSKFVPMEILKYLGKNDLTDLKLGDQSQQTMAIMFSDIRSFTTLSEKLTPEENFNFLNSYFNRMGPVIRANDGFIDKYIGDAIMALFPEKPEDALIAAIEMKSELRLYNAHRISSGFVPLQTGIGIHYGKLMLGIIGESKRFDGTVISDAVNLSSRLEGLTKFYGASIIVSDSFINNISDPTRFRYRLLDFVRVKGKEEPVSVYEIFEDMDDPIVLLKMENTHEYEKAFYLYIDRDFKAALEVFNQILTKNPYDKAVRNFCAKCEHYLTNKVADDWDGADN